MSRIKLSLSVLLLFLICSAVSLCAQQAASAAGNAVVPPVVKFSGILTDVNDKPLTGTVGVTFSLYNQAQGGAALWIETQNVVTDKTGRYTVMLGSSTSQGLPPALFASGEARWLGVQVQGQVEQPRTVLMSVPYALKAADAETIGGLPPSAFLKASDPAGAGAQAISPSAAITGSGTVNHITKWLSATKLGNSNIFDGSSGNVGIATTSPGATLDVNGTAVIRSNATVDGNLGAGNVTASTISASSSGATIVGTTSGPSQIAITGNASATGSGGSWGVLGTSGTSTGAGTVGMSSGATGSGVYAVNSASTGGYAVFAVANGTSATGVYATAANSGSTAVYGAGGNTGVFGSGATYGVAGGSFGSGTYGVYGTNSDGGIGVVGTTDSSTGVGGAFYNNSTGDALFAYEQSGGYAAFLEGNVDVDGNLSKAGGSFKIDHPLDPANKYLYHSFVESPDMKNIYDGNVTTDVSGLATVTLPDWFEALNRDFRYQLTVIGQFAQAIVGSEVSNHQFTIKTDKPNVKVSWQVTGIRQDAWANAHRIPVEVSKAPADQGLYLHPELFGAPAEKSIALAHHPIVKLQKQQAAKLQTATK
jgi:hypothetical protein